MTGFTVHRRRIRPSLVKAALFAVVLTCAVAAGVIHHTRNVGEPIRVSKPGRSYGLPRAQVMYDIQRDGSMRVTERVTFNFTGFFSGALRDIPLASGERISNIVVCERMVAGQSSYLIGKESVTSDCPNGLIGYASGGATKPGSFGMPGTFGVKRLQRSGSGGAERVARIVWHYNATDANREFVIRYRATGWIRRVGADQVLVKTVPWGSEWKASLARLTATIHPADGSIASDTVLLAGVGRGNARVSVSSSRNGQSYTLRARDITAGERIEFRALGKASAFGVDVSQLRASSVSSDQTKRELREVQTDSRTRSARWRWLEPRVMLLMLAAALVGLAGATLWVVIAWRRSFAELPHPADVPRLLDTPPTDLAPAMAAALLAQTDQPASTALVATVCDLIRRKQWRTIPADDVDVALCMPHDTTTRASTRDYEQRVLALVDRVIEVEPDGVPLTRIRRIIQSDRDAAREVAAQERRFRASLTTAIRARSWFELPSNRILRWPARMLLVSSIVFGALLWLTDAVAWRLGQDPRSWAVLTGVACIWSVASWSVVQAAVSSAQLRTRWTSASRTEAAKWTAYRDFLDSYGHMGQEPTASIELWEQHLVYAVAFGCAARILATVRPQGAGVLDDSSMSPLTGVNSDTFAAIGTAFSTGAIQSAGTFSASDSSSFDSDSSFSDSGGGGGGGDAW